MKYALTLLCLVGCSGEATFPRDAAEAGCAHAQVCDEASFTDAFGTLDECSRREGHLMEDAAASAAELGCTFDKDKAAECLDALATEDCATFELEQALTRCGGAFGCVP